MTTLTGPGIHAFRFASVKLQLKLEPEGMKGSGGALRPRLAKEFGLKPRSPHADYIAYCDAQLKALKEAP